MSLFGSLFGITKMNADANQQQCARLLIEAAEDPFKYVHLVDWLIRQAWPGSETRARIAHALSIVKVSSVPATYACAKEIARDLHEASYRLG